MPVGSCPPRELERELPFLQPLFGLEEPVEIGGVAAERLLQQIARRAGILPADDQWPKTAGAIGRCERVAQSKLGSWGLTCPGNTHGTQLTVTGDEEAKSVACPRLGSTLFLKL